MGYNGIDNNRNGICSINHKDRKIYIAWYAMLDRCYNKKHKRYIDWGGRGISVCDEWLNDFMKFYYWAKENGWKEGLELDRIDNNGNYEPSNCQLITHKENCSVSKRRKPTSNKSGYIGVFFAKNQNKYRSYITINKKRLNIGSFNTKEEALQARIDAEVLYFGKQLTNLNSNQISI